MASRGELQKQISIIFTQAISRSFKIEEIIPEEWHDQMTGLEELKTAREFIKQIEEREDSLRAENVELLAKLKAKEVELEDQPEDYKAAKVDLQQAQRSIEYYKQLAANDEERAERYQRKLKEALDKQTAADDAAQKIDDLQTELDEKRATILALQEHNRVAAETHEQIHNQDQKLLKDITEKLAIVLSHSVVIENESEQFSEACSNLIETLESEHATAAAAMNNKSILLLKMNTLHATVEAEVAPLKSCLERAFSIVNVYQCVFKALANPCSTAIGGLPPLLDALMLDAAVDLQRYQSVHQSLEDGSAVQDQVRLQLQGIATTLGLMINSFDCIKDDVGGFLGRLRHEPRLWSAMKAKFGFEGRMKRFTFM